MAALHDEVKRLNTDEIKRLIGAGEDINAVDGDGRTPLFIAAQDGSALVVQLLLKNGADINIKDNADKWPRFISAENGCRLLAKNQNTTDPATLYKIEEYRMINKLIDEQGEKHDTIH